MVAVLVCSIVSSGLIVGLLSGIATELVRSRVGIATALRADASESLRPLVPTAQAFA